MAESKVSPDDVYGYLHWAQREGVIGGFTKLRHKGRVVWKIETISTRYDHYHDIQWVPIVLTTREVCAFMEGVWAAKGFHPSNRAGGYRAGWDANHITPLSF